MANKSSQYSPLQIMMILFIISFGAYGLRFVFGLGGDVGPQSVDPLKGVSSAAELNTRINHALMLADQTGLLRKDDVRLKNFLFLPPAAAVISLVICIGAAVYKKRHAINSFPKPTSRLLVMACGVCVLLPLVFTIMVLTKHEFLSRPLRILCGNQNTKPPVVTPGSSMQVRIDYSPGVSSIQQRHSFDSVRISNLTYKTATGESGPVEYRNLGGGSGESPSEWRSFNRVLPEVRINDIYAAFTLPDLPALQGSLVSGDVEAGIEYPAWVESDRPGIRNSTITGHFSFWVANAKQAAFAAAAQKFRDWEENLALDNISLYSLLFSGGVFMAACNMVSKKSSPAHK